MNNLKLGRRLRLKKIRNKKKKSKSRKGSSVYNKNEYIYNWVHIISTPMK